MPNEVEFMHYNWLKNEVFYFFIIVDLKIV